MIRAVQVTRRYGRVVAVDAVSFEIPPGQIVGFLGPNGAGKSTLLKMLATYLPPSAGSIEIAGHDVAREPLRARQRLGYLPEHNALFEAMRVDRFLAFVARVRGLSGGHARERMDWVVERCGIADVATRRIRECSKGYRQRIGLAAALVHDPPVLLLDEPTHGLDPLQVESFRAFLQELRPGHAIFFSSHILAEVTAISTRLLAIHRGRIVLDDSMVRLRARAEREGQELEEIVLSAVRAASPASPSERATGRVSPLESSAP